VTAVDEKADVWLTRKQFSERFGIQMRVLEYQFTAREGAYAKKLGRMVRYPLDKRGFPMEWPEDLSAK
jgi:hypothetical protein